MKSLENKKVIMLFNVTDEKELYKGKVYYKLKGTGVDDEGKNWEMSGLCIPSERTTDKSNSIYEASFEVIIK